MAFAASETISKRFFSFIVAGRNHRQLMYDSPPSGIHSILILFIFPGANKTGTITVAGFQEAVLGAIIRVTFVRGAIPALNGRDVLVQGTIGGVVVYPEIRHQPKRRRGWFAPLTAEIAPARRDRVSVPVIVHVE